MSSVLFQPALGHPVVVSVRLLDSRRSPYDGSLFISGSVCGSNSGTGMDPIVKRIPVDINESVDLYVAPFVSLDGEARGLHVYILRLADADGGKLAAVPMGHTLVRLPITRDTRIDFLGDCGLLFDVCSIRNLPSAVRTGRGGLCACALVHDTNSGVPLCDKVPTEAQNEIDSLFLKHGIAAHRSTRIFSSDAARSLLVAGLPFFCGLVKVVSDDRKDARSLTSKHQLPPSWYDFPVSVRRKDGTSAEVRPHGVWTRAQANSYFQRQLQVGLCGESLRPNANVDLDMSCRYVFMVDKHGGIPVCCYIDLTKPLDQQTPLDPKRPMGVAVRKAMKPG